MVTWNELSALIQRNPSRSAALETFAPRASGLVEFVKLSDIPVLPTKVAESPLVAPPAEGAARPEPVLEVETAVEPIPVNTKTFVVSAPPPVLQTKVVKAPVQSEERGGEVPHAASHVIDPVVLGIENSDPLYVGAPARTRHTIEIEEAQRLEGCLDALYKSDAGRSRGWTKVGLEAMIKPRCASGGDLKELERAKKPFVWQLLETDKGHAAFLDYVCVAKKIRVAVWNTAVKKIVVYPAADATTSVVTALEKEEANGWGAAAGAGGGDETPLYNVDAEGHPMSGGAAGAAKGLLEFCDAHPDWTLLPPSSVLHSLSGLTLAELESVATKLGMDATTLPKGKANQVQALAAHKLRARLAMRM
jgi:hypothetical protein